MVDLSDDVATRLEREYPLLDSALVRAIVLDFDVSKPANLEKVRDMLMGLQSEAVADESDAAPTATDGDTASSAIFSADCLSVGLTVPSSDGEGANPSAGATEQMHGESEEDKVDALRRIFPTVAESEIRFQLKKAGFSFESTLDVLLNIVYLDSTDGVPSRKGVDAFFVDETRKGKKGTNRAKGRKSAERPTSTPGPQTGRTANSWVGFREKVEFIARRTGLTVEQATSVWYAAGCSVKATLNRLVRDDIQANGPDAPEGSAEINCLVAVADAVPGLPAHVAISLCRICRFNRVAATELAEAYRKDAAEHTTRRNTTASDSILPSYRRPTGPEIADVGDASAGECRPRCRLSTSDAARDLSDRRQEARQQMAEAARKAGSNKLYSGAVAYYASKAAEAEKARQDVIEAELADRVNAVMWNIDPKAVAAAAAGRGDRVGPIVVDLHGLIVAEALSVVEQVLGLVKAGPVMRKDKTDPIFNFVVGKGIHSHGRTPRLAPAVTRLLANEGWQFEVFEGQVFVHGRQ